MLPDSRISCQVIYRLDGPEPSVGVGAAQGPPLGGVLRVVGPDARPSAQAVANVLEGPGADREAAACGVCHVAVLPALVRRRVGATRHEAAPQKGPRLAKAGCRCVDHNIIGRPCGQAGKREGEIRVELGICLTKIGQHLSAARLRTRPGVVDLDVGGKFSRPAIPGPGTQLAVYVCNPWCCKGRTGSRHSRDGPEIDIDILARPCTGGLADQPRGGDGLSFCWTGERHCQQDGDQIKSGGGVFNSRFMSRFS